MINKPSIPKDLLEAAINQTTELLAVVLCGVEKFSRNNEQLTQFAQKLEGIKRDFEAKSISDSENKAPNKKL